VEFPFKSGTIAGGRSVRVYNSLNVITKIPLEIKGEQKTHAGYLNKLELLNIKDNLVRFYEHKERKLIIVRLEDVVYMIRDSSSTGGLNNFEIKVGNNSYIYKRY